jgi:hypothetical protein
MAPVTATPAAPAARTAPAFEASTPPWAITATLAEAQGLARRRLRERCEDGSQVDVARAGRGPHLVDGVGRDADQGFFAEDAPRGGDIHGVEAQVDAVGADGEGDVGAAVHDDAYLPTDLPGAAPRRRGHVLGEGEQLRSVESALPHLHPVDPGAHGGLHRRRQRPRAAAVDHEAENGTPGDLQKLASPSRGLDAEA